MSLFVDINAHLAEVVWAPGMSPFVNMPNSETKVGKATLRTAPTKGDMWWVGGFRSCLRAVVLELIRCTYTLCFPKGKMIIKRSFFIIYPYAVFTHPYAPIRTHTHPYAATNARNARTQRTHATNARNKRTQQTHATTQRFFSADLAPVIILTPIMWRGTWYV